MSDVVWAIEDEQNMNYKYERDCTSVIDESQDEYNEDFSRIDVFDMDALI